MMMTPQKKHQDPRLPEETRPMTETEIARCLEIFNTASELRLSFPIRLENGAIVNGVRGVCAECKGEIDPANVRGRVSWPIATVAVVEASGLCRACNRMTQLYMRLRPVGDTYRAETLRLDGRGWQFAQATPPSWWRRLWRWMKREMTR